jgi:hypothetical protein
MTILVCGLEYALRITAHGWLLLPARLILVTAPGKVVYFVVTSPRLVVKNFLIPAQRDSIEHFAAALTCSVQRVCSAARFVIRMVGQDGTCVSVDSVSRSLDNLWNN